MRSLLLENPARVVRLPSALDGDHDLADVPGGLQMA